MMEGPVGEILARNHARTDFGKPPPLLMGAIPREHVKNKRGVLILTCCDPRLNPHKILQIEAGIGKFTLTFCSSIKLTTILCVGVPTIHLRNPGGRAAEAIKSLAVMQVLSNMRTILIIHHTGILKSRFIVVLKLMPVSDCGMTHANDELLRHELMALVPKEKDSIEKMKFGEIKGIS
jgi:hypothetical protein